MIQVTVLIHTDEFIFVWSFKNGNGRSNSSVGAKTELIRRPARVPKLSSRVTLATSGVVGRGLSYATTQVVEGNTVIVSVHLQLASRKRFLQCTLF